MENNSRQSSDALEWDGLSANPNITWKIVQENPDRVQKWLDAGINLEDLQSHNFSRDYRMDNLWMAGIKLVKERIYPLTIEHLIYTILFTAITFYITEYFLKYKLIRWIYFGTLAVIVVSIYNGKSDLDDYEVRI